MSSSEFAFTIVVTIIIPVFVPGRSRTVQKLKKWVCGTKTETIVTIIVKLKTEDRTVCLIDSPIDQGCSLICLIGNKNT